MAGPVAAGAAVLEAKLASFVKDGRLPGAIAGVVHGNELAWCGAAGFADRSTRRPAQRETLYRIASITKTFTGTAIMRLRDAGLLDLDDPAVAYLPELRNAVSPFAPIEAVTIRRMLSHESGLANEPPGTDWAVPVYQGIPSLTLARAADIVLKLPPNSTHKYSDVAYQLLGEIVTRVSGTAYDQYLRESVLDPLGMSATSFEPLADALLDRRATGYDWRGLTDELDLAPAISQVWAEGGLWSSLEDIAKWLSFQMSAHRDPVANSPVLTAATLREMHKPRYLADDDWTVAWGISWCANRVDDVVWVQHSGGLPGFTSTACFDPRTQVGAVVLLNGTSNSVAIAHDLGSIARGLVLTVPPVIEMPAPAPAQYAPLLGAYARPGLLGWILRLEWRDGKLTFIAPEAPDWQLKLVPTTDPDVFTPEPGSDFAGEDVRFRRLVNGLVTSVHVMDCTFARLDPVEIVR
jgi:CubicO group peptidase (beta-lactamase class C family)